MKHLIFLLVLTVASLVGVIFVEQNRELERTKTLLQEAKVNIEQTKILLQEAQVNNLQWDDLPLSQEKPVLGREYRFIMTVGEDIAHIENLSAATGKLEDGRGLGIISEVYIFEPNTRYEFRAIYTPLPGVQFYTFTPIEILSKEKIEILPTPTIVPNTFGA